MLHAPKESHMPELKDEQREILQYSVKKINCLLDNFWYRGRFHLNVTTPTDDTRVQN